MKLSMVRVAAVYLMVSTTAACNAPDGETVGARFCVVSEESAERRDLAATTLVLSGASPCLEGEVSFCGNVVEARLRSASCSVEAGSSLPFCIVRRVESSRNPTPLGTLVRGDSSCRPPDFLVCGSRDAPTSEFISAPCGPELDAYIRLYNSVVVASQD
jgi:hypothetical protein